MTSGRREPLDEVVVTYRLAPGLDPRAVADAIRVEQTLEFPLELVEDPFIRDHVAGAVLDMVREGDTHKVRIGYAQGTAGGGLNQLLNVLWGNVSLFAGVRVVEVCLPEGLLAAFRGPRFGLAGLRALCGARARPLLTTAVKPMGTSTAGLARMAGVLAEAGFDVVKDDHGLADQPWAPWRERVARCAAAVQEANARAGTRCLYLPSMNVPYARSLEAAYEAKSLGAGGLLLMPGLTGLDALRALADDDALGLPLMAHPAFLGANVVNPHNGLDHGVLFGTLMRLAGADLSVFPNHGGRFSFSAEECRRIAEACRCPLGQLAAAWPAPGGGMTLDRIGEIRAFYGDDFALLVGGALHRGDLAQNARRLRASLG